MSAEQVHTSLPSGLRASDADRDRVLDMLTGAVGDGRLTAGEHEERVADALSARTLGDLEVLTADLPAGTPGPAPVKGAVRIETGSTPRPCAATSGRCRAGWTSGQPGAM